MKRFLTSGMAAAALSLPTLAAAQDAVSFDQKVNDVFASSTGWFVNLIFMSLPGTSFPWIVLWLVVAASIFTIYFGFIQFKARPRFQVLSVLVTSPVLLWLSGLVDRAQLSGWLSQVCWGWHPNSPNVRWV